MGKLQTFLRKEVRKSRVKPPCENQRRTSTASISNPLLDRRESDIISPTTQDGSVQPGQNTNDDADSIFGDYVPTKEEAQQAKLERFLAENPLSGYKETTIPAPRHQEDVYSKIRSLKEELQTLNTFCDEANSRQQNLVQRQRVALEEEIRYLGDELLKKPKGQKMSVRAALSEELASLPEPLSASEKRQIERMKAKREKERAEAINPKSNKPKLKRKKGEYNSDDDLDGEERLRYGKNLKPKPVAITGRWNSVLHDYFPEGDTESVGVGSMSKEERVLYRRELAEYGEKLALVERERRRGGRGRRREEEGGEERRGL